MKMKVLLGVIGAAFLILSLPSVSALTAKEVLKKVNVNEDVSLPAISTDSNNLTSLQRILLAVTSFGMYMWAALLYAKEGEPGMAIIAVIFAFIVPILILLGVPEKITDWAEKIIDHASSHLPQ